MNVNYKTDKNEIFSFVNSLFNNQEPESNKYLLDRFTKAINDKSIDDRAAFIRETILKENEFAKVFYKLGNICNEHKMQCELCPVKKYCSSYIENCRKSLNEQAPKMIDLFCGAGGLSLGFCEEGFVTALANDIQECCIDTYSHNHPEVETSKIVLGDIKNIVENVQNLVDISKIDLVVGGPPCQGFSMANRQRLIDDPRNHLYKSYVEVVKKVKPKFFVMENVKGMLSVASQVVEDFNKIGYSVSYHVLNAKEFGVPQNRERLIYIGNNVNIDNDEIFEKVFKYSESIDYYFLKDALYGLRPLKASTVRNSTELDSEEFGKKIEENRTKLQNDYIKLINQNRKIDIICNHKARYNNDRDIEIFGRLNQGDKSDDPKIADIMPYTSRADIFKDKYYKLVENNVCKTITAHMKFDCNMYIHPTQARGLTPREAARVQSYPDDYFFRGSYTKTYMQIGNSVPPLLGKAIAHILKEYFKES